MGKKFPIGERLNPASEQMSNESRTRVDELGCDALFAIFNTMDTDTPRTDEALRLHYSEGDYFGEETTKEAYEFARELERELNEMTAKQIELVNHLKLYRGQVNNEGDHTACDGLDSFANSREQEQP